MIAGANDDKASEVQPTYHFLRTVAERHDCPFLIIDHTNKGGGCDLGQGLLTELAELDPVRHQQVLAQLNEAALFGQKGDKITPALKPDERAERLQQGVNAALDLHAHQLSLLKEAPLLSSEAEAKLRLWLAAIAKVIADETTVTPDPEQPQQRRVVERPHGKKGAYRIACANDLEATYRDHGKGQAELQPNAALLTSDRFVHQTHVVTGSAPDPTTLVPLLENLHDHHDFFPPKVVADQIYGTGKTRAEVAEISKGQTQLIALVPDYEKRTDRFVPADFTLSDDGFSLTCPNGVTTTKRYPKPGSDDGSRDRGPARPERRAAALCPPGGGPRWKRRERRGLRRGPRR